MVKYTCNNNKCIKPVNGNAPRKHSLHEKTAASVLLKLFVFSSLSKASADFFVQNSINNLRSKTYKTEVCLHLKMEFRWCARGNLNTSDSGLHHTISLMYVEARHLGFGTTWHDRRLGGIGRVVPIAHRSDASIFVLCRSLSPLSAFVGFRKNYISE